MNTLPFGIRLESAWTPNASRARALHATPRHLYATSRNANPSGSRHASIVTSVTREAANA